MTHVLRNPIRGWAGWLLRGAALVLLLSLVAAPRARAVLEESAAGQPVDDRLCVHTRLNDEVYEWRILYSLQMARSMGAGTIVEFFPWAYVEHERGRYDWTRSDMIIRYARFHGLRIIARLGLVPPWVHDQEAAATATLNTLPPHGDAYFARFAAAFAQRYAGQVEAIIVWNEPNLAFEWGFEAVDPARYLALLRTVYRAVEAAAPGMPVLAGALAPTLEPAGSPNAMNDLVYLEALYRGGLADLMDGLAVHTYGFRHAADAPPEPDALNFRRVELLRDIMLAHDDDSPVFITEAGWNDHPRWSHAVRPAQRVRYTLDALTLAQREWPWMEVLCLWVLRFPAPTGSYPDGFTLLTSDFEPRPLYLALQAQVRGTQQDLQTWLPSPRGAGSSQP